MSQIIHKPSLVGSDQIGSEILTLSAINVQNKTALKRQTVVKAPTSQWKKQEEEAFGVFFFLSLWLQGGVNLYDRVCRLQVQSLKEFEAGGIFWQMQFCTVLWPQRSQFFPTSAAATPSFSKKHRHVTSVHPHPPSVKIQLAIQQIKGGTLVTLLHVTITPPLKIISQWVSAVARFNDDLLRRASPEQEGDSVDRSDAVAVVFLFFPRSFEAFPVTPAGRRRKEGSVPV